MAQSAVLNNRDLLGLIGEYACVGDENRRSFNLVCKWFREIWETKVIPKESLKVRGSYMTHLVATFNAEKFNSLAKVTQTGWDTAPILMTEAFFRSKASRETKDNFLRLTWNEQKSKVIPFISWFIMTLVCRTTTSSRVEVWKESLRRVGISGCHKTLDVALFALASNPDHPAENFEIVVKIYEEFALFPGNGHMPAIFTRMIERGYPHTDRFIPYLDISRYGMYDFVNGHKDPRKSFIPLFQHCIDTLEDIHEYMSLAPSKPVAYMDFLRVGVTNPDFIPCSLGRHERRYNGDNILADAIKYSLVKPFDQKEYKVRLEEEDQPVSVALYELIGVKGWTDLFEEIKDGVDNVADFSNILKWMILKTPKRKVWKWFVSHWSLSVMTDAQERILADLREWSKRDEFRSPEIQEKLAKAERDILVNVEKQKRKRDLKERKKAKLFEEDGE